MGKPEHAGTMPCPNCDSNTSMRIVSTEGGPGNQATGLFWELIECTECSAVMLRQGYNDEYLNFGGADDYQLLQPAEDEHISGLPAHLATAYAVALQVKPTNSAAYCALLTRLLRLVCTDQNSEAATLLGALDDLAERGLISGRLADLAGEFQRSRNIRSDTDLAKLRRFDIPVLESLVQAVLAYVYVAPAMVETVRATMDKQELPEGQ